MDGIVIIAEFTMPAAAIAAVRAAIPGVLAQAHAEDGCVLYAVAEDVVQPGTFRVSEEWASRAALDAHIAAPWMAEWGQVRRDLGMTGRKLKIFTVSGCSEA